MTLISALFLIFIFSINTIEATGPKDLNPEKTKAEANLSQSSAVNPAKTKKDLEKQALLKQIILEDASSSADLTEAEIQAIKLELGISENDFILKGLKITVEDDQLKAAGSLKDFIKNPNKIKALLNEAEFIEKIMNKIKGDHKLTGEYSYSLKMGDSDTGSFEIYFYKSPEDLKKDLVKEIILEDASSSADLTDDDKKYIQDQSEFKDIWVSKGFKIRVEDNLLYREKLYNFIENPSKIKALLNKAEFIEKIMEAIKAEHKLTGEYSYSLNTGKWNSGAFEIYFYKNAAKSLKNLKSSIIGDLAKCRDLEEAEIAALKADDKIYDSKYISKACEILIEDRNLANLIGENKVESFKDTDYKQEIADQLNKANLNLDKHMSVYLKVQDITQGRIGVILADTKRKKKSALIEALDEIVRNNNSSTSLNKEVIEKAYGVQYINLGIYLYWADDRFNSGGEFDKSFALVDEILKDPKRRTAWIDRANEIRCSRWNIQQALPNDSNTIIRSRVSSNKLYIDIFTLSESPKGAIQATILDEIDINIIEYSNYESIRSSDAIKGFEAGRSLKQGLKIINYDARLQEGGSLSSYYDNAKEFNPLLDDADFKHKVLDKINDLKKIKEEFKETIDFVFSRDNLENIKIKAQNFRDGGEFDLVVYELEPLEESDPTNPSAGESPAGGASAVDGD